MNPKHGYWDWLENAHKLNFQFLDFLLHMVEIFNSFRMEKTEKEMNFNF